IGREFHGRAVADLCPPQVRTAVPSHLMALVRKELIRPDCSGAGSEDGYRFQHILIRDAAYEALPKRVRAELHERFAVWLETALNDRRVEREEIAGYHFEQAFRYGTELGHREDAVATLGARGAQHLGKAGKRALAGGDVAAAANLLARASASLDDADPARVDLLASLGMARTAAGELETALEALDEAVERAEVNGDRRTRCRAAAERARISFITGRIGPDEARAEAEAAISELEALDDDLGLRLLAAAQATLTGWSELVAGDAKRAEALLRAGYAEFEEMGEQSLLSGTAAELGRVLCKKGSYDEAEKFAATSEELS